MRLPDALRLADEMGLPDLRKDWIETDVRKWNGEKPPCCAIAGANIAAGNVIIIPEDGIVPSDQANDAEDFNWWEDYVRVDADICDICGTKTDDLMDLIVHLYDEHLWSRTEIARFLDQSFS